MLLTYIWQVLILFWVLTYAYLYMFSFRVGGIPMLDQVMSATKGATDAFSGVGNLVWQNSSSSWLFWVCCHYHVAPFFFSFFSIALSGKSVSHILYSLRRWDLQLFPAWLDMELVLVMAMDLVCHMYSYFSILSNNIKFHLFLTLGICYGMAPPADRYYIAWYADAFLLKSLHCFPFYFSIHVFLFGESFVLTVSRVFLPLSLYLLCY